MTTETPTEVKVRSRILFSKQSCIKTWIQSTQSFEILSVYEIQSGVDLTQVTQMRTHYCCRDADRLKKENTQGKKQNQRYCSSNQRCSRLWSLIQPAQIRRAVPHHSNPTPIYPFMKAVSGISRQQTNKCPFLNKGIETIKDKSTYFYSANSRWRVSDKGEKTTFDSSKFSILLIKSGKKISLNRTCL